MTKKNFRFKIVVDKGKEKHLRMKKKEKKRSTTDLFFPKTSEMEIYRNG